MLLFLLVRAVMDRRGEIFARAGPLIYLLFFLLIAYSLSTGNAGTGFRYRTHLVAVAICVIVALWRLRPERARGAAPDRRPGGRPEAAVRADAD